VEQRLEAATNHKKNGEPSRFGQIWSRIWIKVAGALCVVALVGGGVYWWLIMRNYESTDDAFIDADMGEVAPQVAGRVVAVAVSDNQMVKKGDLLVRLDSAPYEAKLKEAEARLAAARAQVRQAQANANSADAQAKNVRTQLQRSRSLREQRSPAISQQELDQAIANDRNAEATLAATRQQVESAKAQIQVAEAAVETARLNLAYTQIRASQEGHVAHKDVAVGDYITPGQAVMALVPTKLWVTANFKETQIGHMTAGQPVTVSVDGCGGREVRGHVDSIQRGAGQAFQVLPPQNATGNFVKVVQRVPVRIMLDELPQGCTLGPGMSVVPSVKVG